MSDSEDPLDVVDEGGDDLFGDEDEEAASPQERVQEDDDLASEAGEDDDGDARRGGYYDSEPQETRNRVVIEEQTYRHRIPKASDDMVWNPRARYTNMDLALTKDIAASTAGTQVHQVHARNLYTRHL